MKKTTLTKTQIPKKCRKVKNIYFHQSPSAIFETGLYIELMDGTIFAQYSTDTIVPFTEVT